jgi:hypothetical protein
MDSARTSRPVRVGDMLATAVPGLGERMTEYRIRAGWVETMGIDVARRCRPGALDAGVLHVIADNSPWLHELTLRSDELLSRLRERHGRSVRALRLSLGPVAPSRTAPAPPRTTPCPPITPEEERALEHMTAGLSDPVIAASLRRLMARDRLARRDHGNPSAARRRNV